jgi:carboxypeptidase family protein
MNRLLLTSMALSLGILTLSLSAQEYSSDRDSGHHPAPVYTKAEKKERAKYRRVHGVVKDEQGNPVRNALVNLTNLKTKETLTFVTKKDGTYSFDDLSRTEDYELVASFNSKKTPVKKLSHFDPQSTTMRILSFAEPDDAAAATAVGK